MSNKVSAKMKKDALKFLKAGVIKKSSDLMSKITDDTVREKYWCGSMGQFENCWYAYYRAYEMLKEDVEKLSGVAGILLNTGWWWTLDQAFVVSQKVKEVSIDENDNFHAVGKAAVQFRDGLEICFVNHINIPRKFVIDPSTIQVEDIIKNTNQEVRRVLLDLYGWDNFLEKNKKCKKLDQAVDSVGGSMELYEIDLGNNDRYRMLRVTNSSPEPDGSFKKYVLHVGPEINTCKDGLGWIHGMNPGEYQPLMET